MQLGLLPICTYRKGRLSAHAFIRAGTGWDYHQGPVLYPFEEGRLFLCWWAYDIQECSNDGVVLYSASGDAGETWESPQVWMASPNAVVSHFQFAHRAGTAEALMIYREGHYYGAQDDRRKKESLRWANYAESPMHLLQKRSHDGGSTWDPPTEIAPAVVVGRDAPPYYGAPEHLLELSNGNLLLLVGYMDPARRAPQHFNVSVLRSSDNGTAWTKTGDFTVPEERGAMEPSVVETEPGILYGVIRNKSGFLYEIRSSDYGETWTPPRKTALPTVESMAKLLRLASGRLLLVWNNHSSTTQQPRHPLAAALSTDGGRSWGAPKVLADETGANQLSNFNLLQAADGRILVCTSHYRALPPACSDLDMLVFDEAWLAAP
ncbi:MAG: exo-alpha-sialidase [Lentisphaerae bacterium]|nr:exo-alpha-sialidase [Lentisphaerota bacterium]